MADRLEIVDALESLAVHCRLPLMDVDARARWTQTWCEDLKDFPIEAIKTACRGWRQSDNIKFPTPGQLLPMVRNAAKAPRSEVPNNQVWAWPSDDELASMSLPERRRQFLIMASETRSKAGPMDRDGNVPRPEHIGRARAYSDEAQHLAEVMAKGAQRRMDAAE